MNNFWKALTLFFMGTMLVLIVTHASGFSKSAGTLFNGVNALGTTLTGRGPGQGGHALST